MLRKFASFSILIFLFSCSKSEFVPDQTEEEAAGIEYKLTTYITGDSTDVVTPPKAASA